MYAAAVKRLLLVSFICCALGAAAQADQADDQFAVAAGHYTAKRWQMAVEEFRVFLREYPENSKRTKAQFFQAESLVQLGKYDEAYPLFVDVLAEQPNSGYAKQALFRAAESAYMSGRTNEAKLRIAQFRGQYGQDKLNAYLIVYEADLALRIDDLAAAEKLYRQSLDRFADMPTADESRCALAKILDQQKKPAEAEKLWREVAQHDRSPWTEMALVQLSTIEAQKKNFQAALELSETLEKRFPKSELLPQARLGRGRALYELGRYADARETLSPLTSDESVAEDARYWLALTQKAEKQFNAAAETLNAALEATKKQAQEAKATTPTPASPSRDRKDVETPAIAASKPLPEVRNSTAVSQIDLQRRRAAAIRYHAAESLLRAGEFNRAIDTLKAGDNASDDPATLSTRYLLAIALQGMKNHDEALRTLRDLDASIERKLHGGGPATVSVHANQLQRLDEVNPRESSGGDREAAAAGQPDVAASSLSAEDRTALLSLRENSRLAIATSLIATEKFADAVEPLQAYLASGRQDMGAERARSALAICLARTQRVDAAKMMLDELKTHHPDSKSLLVTTHHVAEAAYAAERYAVAYDLFSQLAAEGNPPEIVAKGLAGMGWSRLQMGEHETAAEIFGEFLQLFPGDSRAADVTLARGQALEHIGKDESALSVYKQAIGKYRQSPQLPQILMAAARISDRLNQDEEAVSLYQRVAREFPQSDEIDAAMYGWAWALRDLGRGNESEKIFRQLHAQYPTSRFWADTSFRLAERVAQRGDRQQAALLLKPLFDGQCPHAVLQHALYLNAQLAISDERWKDAEPPLRRLIEEFPDSALRMPAEFWYAELAYRSGDYAAAKYRFDTLTQQLRGQTERWVAIVPLRRAQMMVQDKQWEKARELAETIARDYPDFDQQYEADYLIGRCLAANADFDGARSMYQKVVRSAAGGKTETAAMAQWMIGESYFHQENYEAALRDYLRVEILYPYPRWQAAALLQAGKCHEQLGRDKEAAELYAHLVKKHPDSEFADEAAKRLKDIANRPAASTADAGGELQSVLRKK